MIKYLVPNENYWTIDIEGDPIPSTQIWCIVLQNVLTKEVLQFGPSDLVRFRYWARDHPTAVYVGHNAVSYDVPTLNRLLGTSISLDNVVDTLVLSYLWHPNMPGGHSLEAYGERFKQPKSGFDDFSKWSQELQDRCVGDVELTTRLYNALVKKLSGRGYSEKSCQVEHQIRIVVNAQRANGWFFDIDGARKLYQELRDRQQHLEVDIQRLFPPTLEKQGTYQYRTRADGTPYSSYSRHIENHVSVRLRLDEGEYDVYDYETFNIGSPVQRIKKLLSLGWVPQKFTPKGNPQIDEDSVLDFASKAGENEGTVRALAEWLVLQGRATMVNTWLNNVTEADSRMRGTVFTCGAATRRMTHAEPNTANIPKAKDSVPYGKRCRSLWTVHDPKLRRLVGYDAKALEMRMFAHYLNNPDAARLYVEGDPHQVNADLLGIERDPVKNVFYAFLYGAANPKLGWTGNTKLVKKTEQARFGKQIRGILVEKTPGLSELVASLEAEGSWLRTIDGGYVRCEAEHARLNYKLQSAGAIAMKQTSIFLHERIQQRGWDALKVGDIHDEGQLDCDSRIAEEVGKLAVQCIRDAGEELRFRVPLDGEFKVGLSWAETH